MKSKIVFALLLFLGACATPQQKPTSKESLPQAPTSSTQPTERQGPPERPSTSQVIESQGPKPVMVRPVVIVVSPGLARSFALLGVLRTFEEHQIPVSTVVATEIGSFLGTVVASSRSLNEAEWKLLKFEDKLFDPNIEDNMLQRMLSLKTKEDRLARYLNGLFNNERIDDSKIHLWMGIYDQTNNVPVWFDRGKKKEVLRGTLAIPDWFKPLRLERRDFVSSLFFLPYPVLEAKSLKRGPVILLDLLTDDSKDEVKNQSAKSIQDTLNSMREKNLKVIRSADLVIKPNLKDVGFFDFQARNQAVYSGKKAAEEVLADVKALTLVKE